MKFVFSFIFSVFVYSCFGQPTTTEYFIGSRVDIYNNDSSVRARGTVKQVLADGKYKVGADGCFEQQQEILDKSFLKPAITILASDSTLVPFFGKWKLHLYEYPKDYNYNEKPPLVILPDGTYTWYDIYNKPPIISKIIPYAKFKGVNTGIDAADGIVLMDRYDRYWKAIVDSNDHIEIKKMCSDEMQEATRIK